MGCTSFHGGGRILIASIVIVRGLISHPVPPGFIIQLQSLVTNLISPCGKVNKRGDGLLRNEFVHSVNDLVGDITASIFRVVPGWETIPESCS